MFGKIYNPISYKFIKPIDMNKLLKTFGGLNLSRDKSFDLDEYLINLLVMHIK